MNTDDIDLDLANLQVGTDTDRTWEEYTKMGEEYSEMLVQNLQNIKALIARPEFQAIANTNQSAIILIKGFSELGTDLVNELVALKARHAGKAGKVTDDEYSDELKLYNDYQMFSQRLLTIMGNMAENIVLVYNEIDPDKEVAEEVTTNAE